MRAPRWLTATWLVLAAASACPAQLVNPGFEEGATGQPPPGWVFPPVCAAAGYEVALTGDDVRKGKLCAVLSRAAAKGDGFGNLLQSFDAKPYRGQRVVFRAAVRTQVRGGHRAQLWLRVDREGGQRGFFDNMGDRPIVKDAWAEYEIAGDVASDAASITLGCMLFGDGKVWIDEASFQVVGAAGAGNEPPRALEGRALDNLVAFARLYGYVRYFCPSDEAAGAPWETVVMDSVAAVETAKDAKALAAALEQRFRPLAPALRVFVAGKEPADATPPPPPAGAADLQVVAWKHLGVAAGSDVPQSIYSSERRRQPAPGGKLPGGLRDPRNLFRAGLGSGVSCSMPLSSFVVDGKTWPRAESSEAKPVPRRPRPPGFTPNGNDRDTRLADVVIAWNVFQCFYPYFDAFGAGAIDWPAALREALKQAAVDRDEQAFLDTLRRMVARLRDGHGNVWSSSDAAMAAPPILWDWIEGQLVVTVVREGLERPAPGDVVRKIDGRPALQAIEDVERLISGATPQWLRWQAVAALLRGERGSEVTLEVQPLRGDAYTVTLRRERDASPLVERRPPPIHEVKPGYWYVDIERIDDAAFQAALEKLTTAAGIVIDFRGYPRKMPISVLSHLMRAPGTSPSWNVPLVTQPDRQGMTFETSNWPVTPTAPRLTAKVAFITDGRAISAAETMLGIVEQYKLGAIVGGTTAGTNGNVNPFRLPGGYQVVWTGMKVLKHDGSRHHGIGILPTVPASRTRKGVAEGRDELLERALEAVGWKG